jgi:hypothetical protein
VSKLGEGMRELERLEGERSDMISRIELLSRDQDSRYRTAPGIRPPGLCLHFRDPDSRNLALWFTDILPTNRNSGYS